MTLHSLPDEVTGYPLDYNENSFWSIITPEATENLIPNPSFERGVTGYTISNVLSSGRDVTLASRGCYSYKLTPTGSTISTIDIPYQETGKSVYTFSVDIYHSLDQTYTLRISDASRNPIGFYTFKATYTGWGRYSVSVADNAANGTGLTRYAVVMGATSNTKPFYVDGWQVEMKPYPTTYCDGDMVDRGFHPDPYAYGWNGTIHESRSFRSSTACSGGKVVSLWDFVKFKTTAIVGLGLPNSDFNFKKMGDGSEIIDGYVMPSRDFSVVGKIYGRNSRELEARKQALNDLLNTITRRNGQVIVRYQSVDYYGKPVGIPLQISCAYVGGMEGNFTNFNSATIELRFKAADFALVEEFGSVASLAYDGSLSDDLNSLRAVTGVLERDPNTGKWSDLGTGTAATTTPDIEAVVYLPDGSLVVGGDFTTIAGVSARRLAKWDIKTKTWSELAGGADGKVKTLALGKGISAGLLFVGGEFLNNGAGSVSLNHAAYVTLATNAWTRMDTGINNYVLVMAAYHDGSVYVGGSFTNVAIGGTPLHHIGVWNPQSNTFSDLSTSTDSTVYSIVEGPDGNVYIGGDFIVMNGVTHRRVVKYDVANNAFVALASGLNSTVYKVGFGPDGLLYAGGSFNSAVGGPAMFGFARFNGGIWEAVGNQHASAIYTFDFDKRGVAYLDSSFATAGEYPTSLYTPVQCFNGSSWVPFGVFSSAGDAPSIQVSPGGKLLIGINHTTTFRYSGYTAVNYTGTAAVQPSFRVISNIDTVTLYELSNWTTGAHLYFKSLVLKAGDELFLDNSGDTFRVYSLFQGDLTNKIMLGASDLAEFKLIPGINHITTLLVTNTPSVSKVFLYWKNQHNAIEVATR